MVSFLASVLWEHERDITWAVAVLEYFLYMVDKKLLLWFCRLFIHRDNLARLIPGARWYCIGSLRILFFFYASMGLSGSSPLSGAGAGLRWCRGLVSTDMQSTGSFIPLRAMINRYLVKCSTSELLSFFFSWRGRGRGRIRLQMIGVTYLEISAG